MKIYYDNPNVIDNVAVAIGVFDGIHIGHKKLIEQAVLYSRKNNMKSCVFTFAQSPSNAKLVTSPDQRNEILKQMGVDILVIQNFSDDFKNLSAEEFFGIYLKKAKFISVGFNFRFGKNRLGDVKILSEFCIRNSIECGIIEPVMHKNNIVSSTFIRKCIMDGDLATAREMLGRHYAVDGIVESGDEIGRTIGFPTANIRARENRALPPKGVYATMTDIDREKYCSITNYGGKPTIRDGVNIIETYVFDFESNLYGRKINVSFVEKIRDIKSFPSIEALTQQLERDKATAKKILLK